LYYAADASAPPCHFRAMADCWLLPIRHYHYFAAILMLLAAVTLAFSLAFSFRHCHAAIDFSHTLPPLIRHYY